MEMSEIEYSRIILAYIAGWGLLVACGVLLFSKKRPAWKMFVFIVACVVTAPVVPFLALLMLLKVYSKWWASLADASRKSINWTQDKD